MIGALLDARQFLWRHGCAGDATVDPVELIRDLVIELEKHEGRVAIQIKVKKPKASAKPKHRTP